MKVFKNICFCLLFVGFSTQVNAQFWKKLKKNVERRVEETVINKTEDKAAEQTEKAMEEILNPSFGKNSPMPIGGEKGSLEDVPENYGFDWRYELVMIPQKGKDSLQMSYYLREGVDYFGAKMENSMPMFMVFDGALNSTILFIDQGGTKMAMVNKIPNDAIGLDPESNPGIEDFTMTKIDGKQIMGYDCQGYVFENTEYKFTTYTTFEAPVSFTNVFGQSESMPKGFKEEWLMQDGQYGLMMEMHMEDKKKPKKSMKMYCVELIEEPFTINKSDYESFGGQ